jgi:putative ABC transport system permease protein
MRDWRRYVRERLSLSDKMGGWDEGVIDELACQLEDFYHEALAGGASEEEADADAREQIGDWGRLASDVLRADASRAVPRLERWLDRTEARVRRKGAGWAVVADFGQDVRFALRSLRRSPGFLAVALLILALGIGVNTSIFSVVKAVLLRPLPYPEPDRLVMVWQSNTESPSTNPLSVPDFIDWRERARSLEEWGAYSVRKINLSGDGVAQRVQGAFVTHGLMKALGVEPVLGRPFTEQEEQPGNDRVLVISDGLWKRRFASDPAVLGRSLSVNGESYTVVGIMPEGFEFPLPWWAWQDPDLYLPLALSPEESGRDSHWLFAVGRLTDNMSIEQAEAELKTIAAAIAEEYPETNALVTARLPPLLGQLVGRVSRSLWILLGAVGLVLLIACGNIAALVMAKGASRRRELAIRTSLGAGRGRLLRQLITESLTLATLGGIAGVLLAAWSTNALRGAIPHQIPRIVGVQIDGWVLLFSIGATLLTGIVFGLAPALATTGVRPMDTLREGGRGQTAAGRRVRFLGMLVVAQFALALVLANGAVLMLLSLGNAIRSPELLEPERALAAGVSMEGPAYESEDQQSAFWNELFERVRALPGVEAVGAATQLPLFGGSSGDVLVEGEEFDPSVDRPLIMFTWATGDYFQAAGIPLLQGRTLRDEDAQGDRIGVVVNRALAEGYWPGESPIGKRVRGNTSPAWFDASVVGVVDDVRQWGLEVPPLREIFFPFSANTWSQKWLVVRTAGDPLSLIPSLGRELRAVSRDIPLSDIRTLEQLYAGSAAGRRFNTTLLGMFALLALMLVAAGLYGVMSFNVGQRSHEIGIRIAFGAEHKQIIKLVVGRGIGLSALGIVIGSAGAIASARVVGSMLYGVSALNPASIIGVAFSLAAVALLASLIPAFRATRVDPVKVLQAGQ